ncbi:glyoxalase [Acidisoma sp. 7E03]
MRGAILSALLLAAGIARPALAAPAVAVGPDYDTTHVYVAPAAVDAFVHSFTTTFGGHSTPQALVTVTPTPSQTSSQLLITPYGLVSLFSFRTPVPYPFGAERTGYLVRDMDAAVAAARTAGADVIVAPFRDAIGRDAIIAWPGGVTMQLYWHFKASINPPLAVVPENRLYVSPDAADAFVKDFLSFAGGRVVSDEAAAPGAALSRDAPFRRIRLETGFGPLLLMVTNGQLPFPYGRETTGYGVPDLAATLARATASGATLLIPPHADGTRSSAMVAFPGGYIAEIHSAP